MNGRFKTSPFLSQYDEVEDLERARDIHMNSLSNLPKNKNSEAKRKVQGDIDAIEKRLQKIRK